MSSTRRRLSGSGQAGASRIMNDKDITEHFKWAKKGLFAGAGGSKETVVQEDNNIYISSNKNITSTTSTTHITTTTSNKDIKPGDNSTVVQDIPGKDNLLHDLTNIWVGNVEVEHYEGGHVHEGVPHGAGDDEEHHVAVQGEEHVQTVQRMPYDRETIEGKTGGGHVQEEGRGGPGVQQGTRAGVLDDGAVQTVQMGRPDEYEMSTAIDGGHVREECTDGPGGQHGAHGGVLDDGDVDQNGLGQAGRAAHVGEVHTEGGGHLQGVRQGGSHERVGHVRMVKGLETVKLRKARGLIPDGLVQTRIQNFVSNYPNLGGGARQVGLNRVNLAGKRKLEGQRNEPNCKKVKGQAD
jgi:hypothetical protein